MLNFWNIQQAYQTRGAGAAWSPATPGNLLGWWKADVGITLSGANVTAWADQSGGGRDWSISGGSEPQYSATGWNGATHGVTFVPTDYVQRTSGWGYPNGTNLPTTLAYTIDTRGGGGQRVFTEWHDGTIAEGLRFSFDANHKAWLQTFADTTGVKSTATVDGIRRIVVIFKNSANVDVYVDNVLEINNASLTHTFTIIDRMLCGAAWNLAIPFDGTIAEFSVTGAAWSAGDVSSYQTYSTNKWGGTGSPQIMGVSAISTDTNGTGATATVPGSPATNDVIVAHVTVTGAPSSISPPSGEGWTSIATTTDSAGSTTTVAVYWKRWGTGSTDNTSVSFTGTAGNMRLVLSRLRGCKTSGNPYTASATGNGGGAGTGTTLTAPTATGASQQRVMRFYSQSASAANCAVNTPQASTYGGASYAFTAGVDGACACGDYTKTATPVGTETATSSGTLTNGWAACTVTFTA